MSLEHQEPVDEPDDAAEFARLLEEFRGEGDMEGRDEQVMSLFMAAAQWGENKEPTPWDAALEAYHAAENRQDWTAAADACHQLISVSENPAFAYRGWKLLAGTLFEQERHVDAFAAARNATAAARESEISPLIIPALQDEVNYAVRVEEFEHADRCIQEGLALSEGEESLIDWMRAVFLILRAESFLRTGDDDAAFADLRIAEPLLEKYASSMMLAGPVSALGSWWRTSAWLRLHQGDVEGAKNASQEALWFARRVSEMPQLGEGDRRSILIRNLDKFAEIQEQAGDVAAAEAARKESADLRTASTAP